MFSEGKCWYYGFATLLTKYTMEKITALPLVVQDFNSTCSHSLEFFIFRNQITHCLNSWTFISINKIFQLCTIHLKCWQIRILTWFSVALLFSFIYCSKCICWRCNIGLPFLVMEDFRINQGSWNLAFFLWKENKRVKVSRTAPFFYFKQGTFYWNSWRCIFQVHPLHFIGLGQPSPPTVWLSATLSIATSFSYLHVSHMAFLQFLQNSAAKTTSELYPHGCHQVLPHHTVSWNVSSPCLFVPIQVQLVPPFPPWEAPSLLCTSWLLSLDWSIFSKPAFCLGAVLDKPLVRGLWCRWHLGTWFSGSTWQCQANGWTWWS